MIIKDKLYINTQELGPNLKELCQGFTYKNPEYAKNKRLKVSVKNINPILYHYRIEQKLGNNMLILPRGGLSKVLEFCTRRQINLSIIDRRIEHKQIDCSLINTTVLENNQNDIINTLVKNDGGLIEASPGCLTGDTIINFSRASKGFKLKIKTAYKHFNQYASDYYNWDKNIITYVRSFNGKTIQLHEIENIVYSGKKEVWKIELENGLTLKATSDHKIMTKNGWINLINLKLNESEIMCDTIKSRSKNKLIEKTRDIEIYNIPYHPFALFKKDNRRRKTIYNRISKHRLIYEAYINNLTYNEYYNILRTDKEISLNLIYIDPKIYDIHHKDFNHSNNSIENLECLTKKEHHILHSEMSKYNFNQGIPKYSKIISIQYIGEEDTYDIICKDPYRNFVANGIVVHNSGKTIAILGLISKIKQPTLILVHEFRLSNQWKKEFNDRLIGNYTLGELNGDIKKDGDIVIAIIDSADIMYKNDPDYFNKFGMLIIDECHHVPADTFLNFVNNNSSKYRAGVTGTIKRSDGKHILIYDVLGEKLLGIEAENAKNRITNFQFDVINTNIPFEIPTIRRWTGKKRENVLDITGCIEYITKDTKRNNLIIEKAVDDIRAGYFPLILSDRVEHNKNLHEHLVSLGYKSVLLIGDTRKKTKWEEIQADESIQCIVANTKIASEALDLPRLSSLIPTCPTSNLPKVKQQLGRIRRRLKGKKVPIIHDVCDNLAYYINEEGERVSLLQYMAIKRIKFYKQLQTEYNSTPQEEDDQLDTVV